MIQKELLKEDNLEKEINLATGDSYIMFNDLKGSIVVWINCKKDISAKITKADLIKLAPTLFPNVKLSEILFYLQRGDYIYIDKFSVKPLKVKNKVDFEILPTLKSVSNINNRKKLTTPFGFSF